MAIVCNIHSLLHNNRGSFSYLRGTTVHNNPLSLIDSILIIADDTCIVSCIVHIYPPFTRKRFVSLYFGREVRTRLGVAISEMSGPPVFHIKAGASR